MKVITIKISDNNRFIVEFTGPTFQQIVHDTAEEAVEQVKELCGIPKPESLQSMLTKVIKRKRAA
jgi:hypothetical protein